MVDESFRILGKFWSLKYEIEILLIWTVRQSWSDSFKSVNWDSHVLGKYYNMYAYDTHVRQLSGMLFQK